MAKRRKPVKARKTQSRRAPQQRAKARKKLAKRGVAKKSGKAARKVAARKTPPKRTRVGRSAPAPLVEDTVIDVVDEPISGVVRVTEIEEVNVAVRDSDEENED